MSTESIHHRDWTAIRKPHPETGTAWVEPVLCAPLPDSLAHHNRHPSNEPIGQPTIPGSQGKVGESHCRESGCRDMQWEPEGQHAWHPEFLSEIRCTGSFHMVQNQIRICLLACRPNVCHLSLLEMEKLRHHGHYGCQGLPGASRIPEDDFAFRGVHEIDEIVVNICIIETVFPDEGLEVCTRANGDLIAGLQQCSTQCHIWLNITSCTNRCNDDFHTDAFPGNTLKQRCGYLRPLQFAC